MPSIRQASRATLAVTVMLAVCIWPVYFYLDSLSSQWFDGLFRHRMSELTDGCEVKAVWPVVDMVPSAIMSRLVGLNNVCSRERGSFSTLDNGTLTIRCPEDYVPFYSTFLAPLVAAKEEGDIVTHGLSYLKKHLWTQAKTEYHNDLCK